MDYHIPGSEAACTPTSTTLCSGTKAVAVRVHRRVMILLRHWVLGMILLAPEARRGWAVGDLGLDLDGGVGGRRIRLIGLEAAISSDSNLF